MSFVSHFIATPDYLRLQHLIPLPYLQTMVTRSVYRCIAVIAMLFALAACSIATMAYNNAGVLIGYALDDYVELTPQQEVWLKERVNVFIAWHRIHELPELQRWVNETRERAAGSPRMDDVRDTYARGKALLGRTTEQILPDMALLLRQLDAVQIAHLEARFAKDNRKIAEDLAQSPAKRNARRTKRISERFESWLGDLNDEQIAYIESRVGTLVPLDEMRLADRVRWQRHFIEVIKAKTAAAELQVALRRMILAPEQSRDPLYQAALIRQQEEMMAMTAWLVNHATPVQRARLQKKLSGYASDIAGLLRI